VGETTVSQNFGAMNIQLFFKYILVTFFLLLFLFFIILKHHLADRQVEDEKITDHNAGDKIKPRQRLRTSVLVVEHHGGPPIRRRHLKYC
tara:strand:+ start:3747 stop:4016 length:270 start_codon:yes stop_codon:yes gene_type:complete